MKCIELRNGQIKGVETSFKELLVSCIDNPPKDGFTVTDIRSRLKIHSSLSEANGHLYLEDAEYVILKQSVLAMRWRVPDHFIISFIDAVEGAETLETLKG